MMKSFLVLEGFSSEELKSEYVKGYKYTIRTPELREFAAVWLSKGLIEPIEDDSQVGGSGKVF